MLLGPEGKPFILMTGFEPAETGGDTRLPRPTGRLPSSGYLEAGHSLPPTEMGDNGALRPLMLMIGRMEDR